MKEITLTFTADFTAIVKDETDMALLMNNSPEDVRKCIEQDFRSHSNYDDIHISNFKVFPGGDE